MHCIKTPRITIITTGTGGARRSFRLPLEMRALHGNQSASAIRRVVTGEARDGSSMLASDVLVEPIEVTLLPGVAFFKLWGADAMPALPNDGAQPPSRDWFPPQGGFRFELITLLPDAAHPPSSASADAEAMARKLAETDKLLPGLVGEMDPQNPGMHRTDTVDLIYVTSGRCVLELDGGAKVELKAGDTLVQNGPRHAWHNPYDAPCGLLTLSIGVPRVGMTDNV